MKIKELRQLDVAELEKKAFEIKKELIKVNAQVSSGHGSKNSGQARVYKKTIARIKTLQNEK